MLSNLCACKLAGLCRACARARVRACLHACELARSRTCVLAYLSALCMIKAVSSPRSVTWFKKWANWRRAFVRKMLHVQHTGSPRCSLRDMGCPSNSFCSAAYGSGSKLKSWGYEGFGLFFHLLGLFEPYSYCFKQLFGDPRHWTCLGVSVCSLADQFAGN